MTERMKRLALVAIGLAATTARAEKLVIKLGSPGGLAGWERADAGESTVQDGELVSSGFASWSRPVPLDVARGWVIEARFAIQADAPNGGARVSSSDGRQSVSFSRRTGDTVSLEGQTTIVVDDHEPHTYRLEVAGGRHRLLIDGV